MSAIFAAPFWVLVNIFLIFMPTWTAATEPHNSQKILVSLKHHLEIHCRTGSTRSFWLDASEERPTLHPLFADSTRSFEPLILDASQRSHATSWSPGAEEFQVQNWSSDRSTAYVNQTSGPVGNQNEDCNNEVAPGITYTSAVRGETYFYDPLTNTSFSPTSDEWAGQPNILINYASHLAVQEFHDWQGKLRGYLFMETILPVEGCPKLKDGKYNCPQSVLWQFKLDHRTATEFVKLTNVDVHGCALSPKQPILACEKKYDGGLLTVFGEKAVIIHGDYWAARWSPDGRGFVNQDKTGVYLYSRVDVSKDNNVSVEPAQTLILDDGSQNSTLDCGDYLCGSNQLLPDDKQRGYPWGSDLAVWSYDSKWIYLPLLKNGHRVIRRWNIEKLSKSYPITENIVDDAAYAQPSPDNKRIAFLSTGPDPQPELESAPSPPVQGSNADTRCKSGDEKKEWNVQLYTLDLANAGKKRTKINQMTHVGCNTRIALYRW